MRVIAGKLKSRLLKTGENFRPTTDRARETLFNILQNNIPGSVFVDAFAGSGSVGIEAISRGAEKVYFVESNRAALRVLQENLDSCCQEDLWDVLNMDVWKSLQILPGRSPTVDLFYFDPPYEFHNYSKLVAQAAVFYPNAMLIVEHSSRAQIQVPEGIQLTRTVRIGETEISFFQKWLQGQE